MPGLRATRAALDRRIRLDGGGRAFIVRPPSVRDAFELIYVLSHSDDSDSDRELQERIVRRIFPEDLADKFVSSPDFVRIPALKKYLFDGIPGLKEKDRETAEDASPAAWDELFFDYVDHFKTDPWTTYTETPFPFFVVAVSDHLPLLAARRTLRDAQITQYGSGNMSRSAGREYVGLLQRQIRRARNLITREDSSKPRTEAELKAERDRLEAALSSRY